MTLEEFSELVHRMREAQRAYFKHRGFDRQKEAMDLERQVDAAIAAHYDKQRPLFTEEEQPNAIANATHEGSRKSASRRQDQGARSRDAW